MGWIGKAKNWTLRHLLGRDPEELPLRILLAESLFRRLVGSQVEYPPPADTHDQEHLAEGTDAFNEASETYFLDYPNREFILSKPYSDATWFPKYLFNLGVLFHWLRISPGDVVLELGAGTAWVSHFLNLYGCRTIAVDVSATALDLAQDLFRRDQRTRWDLEPSFETYDGYRLPGADGSCDRIVLHDAFHHIPNQETLLREMARVLRPGGIVAMVEPGRRHSLTVDSRREMEETGVLENDIVVEELARRARGAGFSKTSVVPLSLPGSVEVPAEELEAFLRGKGLYHYWLRQAQYYLAEHFILLYKGEYVPTTRRPEAAWAEIELLDVPADGRLRVTVGEAPRLRARLTNRGNTLWLPEDAGERGRARLGAHLFAGSGQRLGQDWFRAPLERAVAPGEIVELALKLPALQEPGTYRAVFDVVAEGVLWFAQEGSPETELVLEVAAD
jgi:SAM-dependent methyltransferase